MSAIPLWLKHCFFAWLILDPQKRVSPSSNVPRLGLCGGEGVKGGFLLVDGFAGIAWKVQPGIAC
jgi:hypothetical protein